MHPRSLMLSTERVVLRGADVAFDVAVDVEPPANSMSPLTRVSAPTKVPMGA